MFRALQAFCHALRHDFLYFADTPLVRCADAAATLFDMPQRRLRRCRHMLFTPCCFDAPLLPRVVTLARFDLLLPDAELSHTPCAAAMSHTLMLMPFTPRR